MAAQNSQGIQILLEAEKEAGKIVQKGRTYRVQRLKDAKLEAAKEVEALKAVKAAELAKLEQQHSGTSDEAIAKVNAATEERLSTTKAAFLANKDAVIERLLKTVVKVQPSMHVNAVPKGSEKYKELKMAMAQLNVQ